MHRYGEQPGTSYDAAWWHAVHRLYDEAFPGLPQGIGVAAAAGVAWAAPTTPFALFEGDRCVAHVGVVTHPMWLGGALRHIAGIHAVCTTADHRRKGLCRRLMADALAWADDTHDIAKLHTDDPPVYTGHGFVPTPTWRFRSTLAGPRPRSRLLTPTTAPADAALLADLLARRAPPSLHCGTAEPGWLVTIDAALSRRIDSALHHLPDHDAIVCVERCDDGVQIVDVIAETLPPAEVVAGLSPDPAAPLWWTFAPDRFEPDAAPSPSPADHGTFMVRGDWPELGPFGISPLWEH